MGWYLISIVLLLIVLTACNSYNENPNYQPQQPQYQQPQDYPAPIEQPQSPQYQQPIEHQQPPQPEPIKSDWTQGNVAIPGNYADAEVIQVDDQTFRMYFSVEPEVPGNKLEVYSATSNDGEHWEIEQGQRKQFSTFPDVIKINNKFRMYFQSAGEIKSAISDDGLNFKDEYSTVITKSDTQFNFDNVAAPSVIKLDDSYIMVYRGTINKKYKSDLPNPNTQILMWAKSENGINFVKQGIAVDSRNDLFEGLLDGPELVQFSDNSIRLYYWSYKGIYHSIFDGEKFSEPVFDYTTSTNSLAQYPENPPGDPTLAFINNKWFMYYGQHTKGIFYATYNQ